MTKKRGRPFGTTGAYKKDCDKTKLTTFSLYAGEADLIRKYIKVIRKYKTNLKNVAIKIKTASITILDDEKLYGIPKKQKLKILDFEKMSYEEFSEIDLGQFRT